MTTRKVGNPLALAVLATLSEAPNHPYDVAQLLRSRGKDQSIKINYGSLYTVVRSLERHGLIEEVSTEREGLRPERTVYAITGPGREELQDWMSELLGVRQKEYPRFETALALAGVMHPDKVLALLDERLAQLARENAATRGELARFAAILPRLFLIESEYSLAMAEAEETFVRGLAESIRSGELGGLDGWRSLHETGLSPEQWEQLDDIAKRAAAENGRRSTDTTHGDSTSTQNP
jgi:DNA-binding PadR family transcriptional regulator